MAKMQIVIAGAAMVFAAAPAPAPAQDDYWMGQFDHSLQQQYDYTGTMIGNNTVQKSVENNYRRRNGQAPVPDSASRERARATCANGRRMRARGDANPGLVKLEQMCVQTGL